MAENIIGRNVSLAENIIGRKVAPKYYWLISHDRKYIWLIYCERKTLLND